MVDLAASPPLDGVALPAVDGATLALAPDAPLWGLAPFRDREEALATALGAALPRPGASVAVGGGLLLWAGLRRYLLRGPEAAPEVGDAAAVVDLSDGWLMLALQGERAGDVLARLLPLDVAEMAPGSVALSPLRHVPCILLAGSGGFDLLVPRSFAASAVADLAEAMRSVAARARIG